MQNQNLDFKVLYSQYFKKIYNFLKKRISSKEDAEDITEEVFIRVYKKLADFKWQGISIESWIFAIARNLLIDHFRSQNKYKNSFSADLNELQVVDENQIDPLLMVLDDEEQKKLFVAISNLDAESQYLIYYKYYEELNLVEISKRLNLSETNIGTRLYRLRKKMLEYIQG